MSDDTLIRITIRWRGQTHSAWVRRGGPAILARCWYAHIGDYLRKLNTPLSHDPAIPHLSLHATEMSARVYRKTCTRTHTAVLSIITPDQKQMTCSLMSEWIDAHRCIIQWSIMWQWEPMTCCHMQHGLNLTRTILMERRAHMIHLNT